MYQNTCPFCQIVQKKIPSYTVYQDQLVQAFLDINPSTKGHTLVIPKEHFETLDEIPANFLQQIILVSQKLSKKYQKLLQFDGINLLQSNHKPAGQVIPHFHLHLIPRYQNDGLSVGLHKKSSQKIDLAEIFKKLKDKTS